jgi:hypothetical protein
MKSPFIEFPCLSAFFGGAGVMELLREHVWRTVMESKQSQFWNAVSVAALTVVTAILYVYSAFLLSLWLLKRNKTRMGGTTARRSRQPTR